MSARYRRARLDGLDNLISDVTDLQQTYHSPGQREKEEINEVTRVLPRENFPACEHAAAVNLHSSQPAREAHTHRHTLLCFVFLILVSNFLQEAPLMTSPFIGPWGSTVHLARQPQTGKRSRPHNQCQDDII